MAFWNLGTLKLEPFRPGITSRAEMGDDLIMACMQIGPGKEDSGHEHPFDQCGIVVEGEIEMSIGEEKRLLKPMETYFIPVGIRHSWKTAQSPAKILDIVLKQ